MAQDLDDVEILVHESGDDPDTADAVAEVGDSRTRHLKTGEPVAMSENWERAVAAARGDYITIIGDDDAILPSACSEAAQILDRYPLELLTWRPAAYFWPESAVTPLRNRLQSYLPAPGFELQEPRALLDIAYHFRDHHYTMPMILHSFVSRELIDRVRDRLGGYFCSAAPDIASGAADAYLGRSCILSHRPLSISGLSHHSTGSRMHFNRNLELREESEKAAFATKVAFHPSLVDSRNSQIFAANEMISMKQALFPDEPPQLDYRNLIQRALDTLNTGLEDYEAGLSDIRRTAELNGIDLDDFVVPEPVTNVAKPALGVQQAGEGVLVVDIDCSLEGVADVAGAAKLLASVLPDFEPPAALPGPPAYLRTLSRPFPADGLRFSRNGNGLLMLSGGWAQAEDWGVWTVARQAGLTLEMEPGTAGPLIMQVTGRMFVHPDLPDATGSVLVNGVTAAEIQAGWHDPAVDLRLDVPAEAVASGPVRVEFLIDSPTSPASAGISPDTRSLGFGLEQITLG